MKEKIMTPTGAGTPARAGGDTMDNVYSHFTTANASCQIQDLLFEGRANARTARELAESLGVKPRDVTRLIERARLQGTPICATCDSERPGYYLAADAEELGDYLRRFKARRRTIARTEAALMATLCDLTGQTRMDVGV